MTDNKKTISALSITGPTASGKTAVSLEVASAIGCEIICCDSMQIYKEMNIGTAKPTAEEVKKVRHHMTDFLPPDETFSAENYKDMALKCAFDISERGFVPLFVGGTGLYIDTVMRRGTAGVPMSDREYCKRIAAEIKTEDDRHRLWERLNEVDEKSAAIIHENNVRRVIRALEVYEKTGKPKSLFDELANSPDERISVKMITLDFHNRENLYERVDTRVDKMREEGLFEEVSALYEKGYLKGDGTASQAIGYKELVEHIEGKCSIDEAFEKIKLSTRRYAKRQLTWFRHEENAVRIYLDGEDGKMRKFADIADEAVKMARKSLNER